VHFATAIGISRLRPFLPAGKKRDAKCIRFLFGVTKQKPMCFLPKQKASDIEQSSMLMEKIEDFRQILFGTPNKNRTI
jgi:hypothetical protein